MLGILGNKTFLLFFLGNIISLVGFGFNLIAFVHSDRQSAFDRDICQIPGKGHILTAMNDLWMNKASHIIDNHPEDKKREEYKVKDWIYEMAEIAKYHRDCSCC